MGKWRGNIHISNLVSANFKRSHLGLKKLIGSGLFLFYFLLLGVEVLELITDCDQHTRRNPPFRFEVKLALCAHRSFNQTVIFMFHYIEFIFG